MTKLVLIIGIESSIARQACKKFLQEGYSAIVTYEKYYNPKSEDQKKFENEIANYPPVIFEQVDLRSKDSIYSLIDKLKTYKLDVIVNCASILSFIDGDLRHEFVEFNYDDFVEVMQYNIASIAAICIGLKDNINSGGCIINITSSAAEEGAFATISYNASKAAVKNLTKSLANNFGGYNVRVNSVAPGWIPASKEVVASHIPALANTLTPARDGGSPENVADAVFSLVKNSFITGANIDVTGGITSSYLMYELEALELQGKLPAVDFLKELFRVKDKLNLIDVLTEIINKTKEKLLR